MIKYCLIVVSLFCYQPAWLKMMFDCLPSEPVFQMLWLFLACFFKHHHNLIAICLSSSVRYNCGSDLLFCETSISLRHCSILKLLWPCSKWYWMNYSPKVPDNQSAKFHKKHILMKYVGRMVLLLDNKWTCSSKNPPFSEKKDGRPAIYLWNHANSPAKV